MDQKWVDDLGKTIREQHKGCTGLYIYYYGRLIIDDNDTNPFIMTKYPVMDRYNQYFPIKNVQDFLAKFRVFAKIIKWKTFKDDEWTIEGDFICHDPVGNYRIYYNGPMISIKTTEISEYETEEATLCPTLSTEINWDLKSEQKNRELVLSANLSCISRILDQIETNASIKHIITVPVEDYEQEC